MSDFLDTLFALIEDRKARPVEGSYTNRLLDAAHSQSDQRLVEELADLTYHSLVLLAYKGLTPDDVRTELEKRHLPR